MQRFLAACRRWQQGFVIATVVAIVALTGHNATATTFDPEIPIPGQFSGSQEINSDLFGKYVRAIYIYFIWVVGIVATGMIIYAGVKWVAAAGDQGRIRDARDMINNAIIGVIIGLTSVVLLNLLSPGFTTLQIPNVATVKKDYFAGAAATDVCARQAEVVCGGLQETGKKIIDPNGKEVIEYCMGTVCKKESVCTLATQTFPGYRDPKKPNDFTADFVIYKPALGCVSNVEIATNTLPDYTGITTLKGSVLLTCGKINSARKIVGTSCNENFQNKLGICYIPLVPAQIVDRSGNNDDILRKMTCPTE